MMGMPRGILQNLDFLRGICKKLSMKLSDIFNPPTKWGNNIFKAHDPAPVFTYGHIPIYGVLIPLFTAISFGLTYPEETAQFKENVRSFISEHTGLAPPTQIVKPE